ncbi:MAG TPA: hypothetical protein VK092_00325 [Deinococcales bacterium]|nr:hypothetical protein [Deinococcales bacterium]
MMIRRGITITAAVLVLCAGIAAQAQANLTGSWLEHEIGFLVTLEQGVDGSLEGTLQGAASPLPLSDLRSQGNLAAGTFMLEGELTGITVELQEDGETLHIWLYTPDANGEPLAGTYESYVASPYEDAPAVEAAAGGEAVQLHGAWLSASQYSPDLIGFTMSEYYPDGTFELTTYIDGMLANWSRGTYTVENGLYRGRFTDWLPQVCFRGTCTPTAEPPPQEHPLLLLDANTFVAEVAVTGQPFLLYAVRLESGLQPPLSIVPPPPPAQGQPTAPNAGGGMMPGMNMSMDMGGLGADMGMGSPMAGSGEFSQGVIYEQDTYTNPDTGQSYELEMVAEPGWDYTSPSGNELSYNEITGAWTEIDPMGWETELESGW